jgi:hypothetical protein
VAETDVDCSLVAPPDLFPVLLTLTSTPIQQSKLTTFILDEWAGWIIIYASHSLSNIGGWGKRIGTRGRVLRAAQNPVSNLCQIVRLLHSHPLTPAAQVGDDATFSQPVSQCQLAFRFPQPWRFLEKNFHIYVPS